jgi:hypothetical protein
MPRWTTIQSDGKQYGSTRNEVDWTTNQGVSMKVIPTEILDKEGNLTRIEYIDETGQFHLQSVWDPNDEQTHENRQKFREWSDIMAKRLNFDVKR